MNKLSNNDILILLEAAKSNAEMRAASIYQKELYLALKELYERRLAETGN